MQPVYDLIEVKMKTSEIGDGDHVPEIDKCIYTELDRHEGILTGQGRPDILDKASTMEQLNRIFRRAVRDAFKEKI